LININPSLEKKLFQHKKEEIKMVEPKGVEPLSKQIRHKLSTCLVAY